MPSHPKVTVEVRESRDNVYKIRHEHQWPIVDTQWTKLYLNHEQSILSDKDDYGNTESESFLTTTESLKFSYIFPQDTEVIGPMKLTLFVSLEEINDANLFIGIQKLHNGQEVDFEGSYGFANDVVSKGFMRVSLSEINEKDSLFYQPEHNFNRKKTIASGEVGFYIDEYDNAGNWISGQYKTGVRSVGAGNVAMSYSPTSSTVAKASLQVIVMGNSGTAAYFDDASWYAN